MFTSLLSGPEVAFRQACRLSRRAIWRLVGPNMPYPLVNFHFTVEWGGQRLGFSEVSGLDVEFDAVSYREGNSPDDMPSLVPGQRKPGRITLRRGMVAGDNDFFDWVRTVRMGKAERRDLQVMLLDEQHQPAFVWRVHKAWPVTYEGPTLNAAGSEIAIESLELAHEGITVEAI